MQRVWGERAGSLGEMKEWKRKRKLVFRGLYRGYYGLITPYRPEQCCGCLRVCRVQDRSEFRFRV